MGNHRSLHALAVLITIRVAPCNSFSTHCGIRSIIDHVRLVPYHPLSHRCYSTWKIRSARSKILNSRIIPDDSSNEDVSTEEAIDEQVSRNDEKQSGDMRMEETKDWNTTNDEIGHFLNVLMSIKNDVYAKIRQWFADLFTIIQRSTRKTEAWIRDDAVGQLVSSAVALIAFFVAVAAFAVWNIQILGGKQWSGPTKVTVPIVRGVPDNSRRSVKFQRPKWTSPTIRTSYKELTNNENESIRQNNEDAKMR